MNARALALAAAAVATLVAPARAQAPDPLDVLEGAAERYGAASALCADFVQSLDNPVLKQRKESHGVLCQRQPDLFSMRFEDPQGDLVVADGTSLWVYYPSLNPKQVFRSSLGDAGKSFDFHREFLERPREKYAASYEGRETVGGAAAHRIRVVPRHDASYEGADLWIGVSDRLVHRIEIRERSGAVRTVALANVRLDPSIAEGTFSFTPPPGAQVIAR